MEEYASERKARRAGRRLKAKGEIKKYKVKPRAAPQPIAFGDKKFKIRRAAPQAQRACVSRR